MYIWKQSFKPCFHNMYNMSVYTYPELVRIHNNDPYYYLLNCFHIYPYCPDPYLMSVLISTWNDSAIYEPAVLS